MDVVQHKGKAVRLTKFISDLYPNMSYNCIRMLIRKKDVKINGERVKEECMVQKGDTVTVYATEAMIKGTILPPAIVYEDKNIIVCDKPVGIEVESKVYNDLTLSVNNYLKLYNESARAVHRLDRNTRGLVIFAKNDRAYDALLKAFKEREIEKYYLAMVVGRLNMKDEEQRCIADYLFKDSKTCMVKVSKTPKPGYYPIETRFRVLERYLTKTLLEVQLMTGRTHQIRAHLAFHGYPLIGDGKYGRQEINKNMDAENQALVAYKIIFHFDLNSPLWYLEGREIALESVIFDF